MFPDAIMQALSETESREVHDRHGIVRKLNKLPQPWDLPVIFAVRISMSLPALFQAVRLYRIRRPGPIQDDFGRTLIDHGQPLTLLSPHDLAQELWFSDGGITSNFPVHFFDNALPRWPTVSLNLGVHPHEAPHQDIWLPQDWDDLNIPVKALGSSGFGFGKAIFNTAMSWRDSLQSALPGYRNRIAQVRTSPGEGGTNLFMPREIIASMALRGAGRCPTAYPVYGRGSVEPVPLAPAPHRHEQHGEPARQHPGTARVLRGRVLRGILGRQAGGRLL